MAWGSEHSMWNQMEMTSHLVWSLIDCVALGKSLYLSDPSFLFHSMRNQHLALRDVCSQKCCWAEFF